MKYQIIPTGKKKEEILRSGEKEHCLIMHTTLESAHIPQHMS